LTLLPLLLGSLLLGQSNPATQPDQAAYTPQELARLIRQYGDELTDIDVEVTPAMEAKAIEACKAFRYAAKNPPAGPALDGLNRVGIRAGFAAGDPAVMLEGAKLRWQGEKDKHTDYTAYALVWAGIFAGDAAQAKIGLDYLAHGPTEPLREWAQQMLPLAADCAKPLDASFSALDGSNVSLSRYRGRVVVMFFWAVWCKPSLEQVPAMKAFHAQRKADGNFLLVGLSMDDSSQTALTGARDLGMKWPQAMNQNLREKFSSGNFVPHVVVLSPAGTVIWQGHPVIKNVLAMTVDFARRQAARQAGLPAGIATSLAAVSAPASAPTAAISVSRPATRPGVSEDDAFAAEQKLKIANMYLKNGMKDRARTVLMEIVQKYPNTPAGQKAAEALLQLR
jgi:hypothetical protein